MQLCMWSFSKKCVDTEIISINPNSTKHSNWPLTVKTSHHYSANPCVSSPDEL